MSIIKTDYNEHNDEIEDDFINNFINNVYGNFADFYIRNKNMWFNPSFDDDYSLIKYNYLLIEDYKIIERLLRNKEYVLKEVDIRKNIFGIVLIHDQLSRHLLRINFIDKKAFERYNIISLKISLLFLPNYYNSDYEYFYKSNIFNFELYLPIERCFLLMPIRHTFRHLLIELSIIPLLLKWRKQTDMPEYSRFYKATIISLANIKKVECNATPRNITLSGDTFDKNSNKIIENVKQLPDNHILYSHFRFLKSFKILIVSLSGGVDSMVLLSIVKHLYPRLYIAAVHINYTNRASSYEEDELCRQYCSFIKVPLFVRTITEIKRDRSFDRNFYEKITRKIRFNSYKQTLQNINLQNINLQNINLQNINLQDNNLQDNNLQDNNLQDIKYNCDNTNYESDTNNEIDTNNKCDNEQKIEYNDKSKYGILLGHNRDDCIENIFANVIKRIHFDNLMGMKNISYEDNIRIVRPMLDIYKSDIIKFAIEYKIPFTWDSTPEWSQRGKMRDILIPSINKFDKNILEGLVELSKQYEEVYKINNSIFENIEIKMVNNDIKEGKMFIIDMCQLGKGENMLNYIGMYFWKKILSNIIVIYNSQSENGKVNNLSNDAIMHFIGKIKKHINEKNKNIKNIQLSKNMELKVVNNIMYIDIIKR